MELKIAPYQVPQAILFNFDELKTQLAEKAAMYEAVVYTDDQVKTAKEDRANLNRLKKAINDERIRQEREYMKPFKDFKGQIDEIITIIDKPLQAIDRQVKEFEERRASEKQATIEAYWDERNAPGWLYTIKPSWLNASYSMKTIRAEIDAIVEQSNKDLEAIRSLPEYAFEAEEAYKLSQSLAAAVNEAHRLKEQALRKAAHEAATVQESRTVEPEPAAEPKREIPAREWIAFKALLTPEEARQLGQWMKTNGILFKPVEGGN